MPDARPSPASDREHSTSAGLAGCLWPIAAGPGGFAALLVLWILILREQAWTLTVKDALYGASALGMVAAQRTVLARAAPGGPAAGLGPYSLVVLASASLAWAVAQSFDL